MPTRQVDSRRMVRATILGGHTHQTANGRAIHIWQRNSQYLARGRWQGVSFGETLGYDPIKASARLRKLLGEIEDGTFIRRSEQPKQIVHDREQRLTFRQLVNAFLVRKRAERGKQTADNYRARLRPALEFSERSESRTRWPLVSTLDTEFVLGLKSFLLSSTTSRNGRKSGPQKLVSGTHVRNCLETVRSLINWALDPMVGKLPTQMRNPVDRRIIPVKPMKNPLRLSKLSSSDLMQLVSVMDFWQICHLGWSLILPFRPDEAVGLLLSDVNIERGWFEFGHRLTDCNFTKSKTQFVLPYPVEMRPLIAACRSNRKAGPLFQNRRGFKSMLDAPASDAELLESYRDMIRESANTIQAEHDCKRMFRRLLKERWGGVSEDRLAAEMKLVMASALGRNDLRLYDLRHHVTQAMKDANLPLLELRYLTGHACNDILHEYTSLKPVEAMNQYFESIRPLIQATVNRARDIGVC